MAGRELTSLSKIRASTILEVLISMVIIMIVFGIAMMIYANVIQSSISTKKIRADAILNDIMLKDENTLDNESRSITIDDLSIQQNVSVYHDDKNLTEIDLAAYDANKTKIAELHKVIITKYE